MERGKFQVSDDYSIHYDDNVAGDDEIFQVLDAALKAGYRHIDTAVAYNNHR